MDVPAGVGAPPLDRQLTKMFLYTAYIFNESLLLGYEIEQPWLKHCCSSVGLEN